MTLGVIILGGTVRINDAGESCPDWPTCFGTWGFDISEAEQEAWYGGAVAIGHPLGATGARVLMTLINALRRGGGGRGVVTICLGGGNAVAMLIECD